MGLGITVQKPIDMADCGCEMTGGGQGRVLDSDAAADSTVFTGWNGVLTLIYLLCLIFKAAQSPGQNVAS